jgi:hypothetical protein
MQTKKLKITTSARYYAKIFTGQLIIIYFYIISVKDSGYSQRPLANMEQKTKIGTLFPCKLFRPWSVF